MMIKNQAVAVGNRILKVTARAFAYPGISGGGNPVTIFLFPQSTSSESESESESASTALPLPSASLSSPHYCKIRTTLAKSCAWESIIVHRRPSGDIDVGDRLIDIDIGHDVTSAARKLKKSDNANKKCEDDWMFHFYMPSGEEVPFCAHAAMGACAVIANEEQQYNSSNINEDNSNKNIPIGTNNRDIKFVSGSTGERSYATIKGDEVELRMDNQLEEIVVDASKTQELLSQIGLTLEDTTIGFDDDDDNDNDNDNDNDDDDTDYESHYLPSFINSSIARHKTLVPILSLDKLHSATNPIDSTHFTNLCDSIQSTGIYLYTHNPTAIISATATTVGKVSNYETRQFPRASGYPEDPATGIAAATLAASLQRQRRRNINGDRIDTLDDNDNDDDGDGRYEIIQGTAMNKRSKINIRMEDGVEDNSGERVGSVFCSGFVEIDSRMEMPIS